MKSMFTMGFFSNDVFQPRAPYLGQVTLDLAAYLGSINDAFNKLGQVNSWIQANPNYAQMLGGQASNFQNLYNRAQADASTATNVQGFLQGYDPSATQVPISQADKDTTDAFISEVNQMLGMIQSVAPNVGSTPTIPNLISQLLPNKGPKPGTPVPAPAASPISTPLLVGGGLLAVGLIVLLVKG